MVFYWIKRSSNKNLIRIVFKRLALLKYCVEIKWSVIRCLDELSQRINMILSYSMAKTVNSLRSNIQFINAIPSEKII
jgi:ribosomal protein S15P/S13E